MKNLFNYYRLIGHQLNQYNLIKRNIWLKQFIKFSVVGGTCMLIDFAIYIVLTRLFFLGPFWSNFISICLSATINFVWNKNWTFRPQTNNLVAQYIKFWLVVIIGVIVNQGLFVFLIQTVDLLDLWSKLIAAAIVWILRFILNKLWSFK